jgi:cytochrome c-type biogenesis protein CcmE
MTRKQRRLSLIFAGLLLLSAAAGLVSYALKDSFAYFATPSDIMSGKITAKRLRLGGLVETGTLKKAGLVAEFKVSDGKSSLPVIYKGVLPDLFREGQGIVAEGTFVDGVFKAETVLAKHDEKYVPKEVSDALKQSGQWKGK